MSLGNRDGKVTPGDLLDLGLITTDANGRMIANGDSPSLSVKPTTIYPKTPTPTVITAFQTGHGWSFGASFDASSNLNDTTDFVLGTQSVRLVSAGDGAGATVGKLAGTSRDMSGSYFKCWIKVTNLAHLNRLQMYAGSSSLANFYLTNILQMSALSAVSEGEWIPVIWDFNAAGVTGSPLKSALTDFRFRLQDDNTGAKVTVQINGLQIIPKAAAFPNGVCSICWDDVYLDAYNLGRVAMDKYGYPGCAFPIIGGIGNGTYLTLAQLQSLRLNNGWQIGAHAYTQAAHDTRFGSMASAAVANEMLLSKAYLASNGLGPGDDLAYPGGEWGTSIVAGAVDVNRTVEAIAKQYFRFGRMTSAWPPQQWPPVTPLRAGALNGESLSLVNFQAAVDQAVTEGEWVIFVWHHADANLTAKIDYLATKGIPVKTIADVLAS